MVGDFETLRRARSLSDIPLHGFENNGAVIRAAADVESAVRHLSGEKEGWNFLQGKRVLDLGCGTRAYTDGSELYPPYFCLICSAHDADTYGVDLYDADPRDSARYTHMVTNLVPLISHKRLSEFVGGIKFDIIRAKIGLADFISPSLSDSLGEIEEDTFFKILTEQAIGILNDPGVYITSGKSGRNVCYLKVGNEVFRRE
jgi:hypothetical protein